MTDNIKLTSSQFDMIHDGKLYNVRGNFISINKNGFIYISKGGGLKRWYWMLDRIKPKDRPLIKLIDDSYTLIISRFRFIIHSKKHYEFIKKYIDKYTN